MSYYILKIEVLTICYYYFTRTLENWRKLKSWKWQFSTCERFTQRTSPAGEKRVSRLWLSSGTLRILSTRFCCWTEWHFLHCWWRLIVNYTPALRSFMCNQTLLVKIQFYALSRWVRLWVIAALFGSFQVNCWLSLQTTFTTDTTSAWKTWCTTWPQRTGRKPKTSSTLGYSPSCSPNLVPSPSLCLAQWAWCQSRLTTSASCTPPRSTKATVPLSPCTSRAHRDTSPGTARPAAPGSPTRRCHCLRTRSSTADICHRCRDSITTTLTSSGTRTRTRSVCTVRSMPCE